MPDTYARVRNLYGTTADWNSSNPILGAGEIGAEYISSTEQRIKVGDGTSTWTALPYLFTGKANLAGGNTFTGNQIIASGGLNITGNTTGGVQSDLRNSNTTLNSNASFSIRSNNDTEYINLVSFAQAAGYLSFNNAAGGIINTVNAQPLQIHPNNAYRAQFTAGGSFHVGTTTDAVVGGASGSGFAVYSSGGFASVTTGVSGTIRRLSSDGSVVLFGRDATNVGNISVTTTATAYNTSSDYRLKENLTLVAGALARVNSLPVWRFNFIGDDKIVDGFMAHEAQAVVPESVTGQKDEIDGEGDPVYQGIDQAKLVPLLFAAVQELSAQVTALTARVATLEAAP